jgi:hypothetical protein
MFERYTERARRVLFFARYEASQLGSLSIETEHLLLGLIRDSKGLVGRIFARAHLSPENVRRDVEGRTVFHEKVSTSVEIPFSAEMKRALGCAAEEADRLLHHYIGTEHLLLGLLREERSMAATILVEQGMTLHTLREDIVLLLKEAPHEDEADEETARVPRMAAVGGQPNYLPSRVVHITYSQPVISRVGVPAMSAVSRPWFALGKTLQQIVAFAWGSEESRVRFGAEQLDGNARYDFTIVLPLTDSPEIIPRLLREAIERDFNVEVTRDEGDPPTLIVTSR